VSEAVVALETMALPARWSAETLRHDWGEGRLSAADLAAECRRRIARGDGGLRAFVRVDPRLEERAAAVDSRRARGEPTPLGGLPVAVKDNLLTAGLETSCGSRILDGFVPPVDATAVARLREAGAVVLGKTNLDEFAMGSSTEHSTHGATRNPWDPERVPGGSSGGSAVAVAAAMAPLALGSDTGGSIRQPAAFCGVVGVKPTWGRVSRSGLVAFASSLDQVGPLAREVASAARLLQAIAGPDPLDATAAARPVEDYVAACGRGVAGMRVGLPREYFSPPLDPAIAERVRAAAAALEREGARVEEVSLPHTRYAVPAYYLVATAEASSNLARYDGVRYGIRRGGGGLRETYRRTRAAGFGPEVKRRLMLGTFALSAGYHERFYGRAQQARALVRRDFVESFRGGVELLLTPVSPVGPFRLGEKLEDPLAMYLTDVYTVTANLAGVPALAVPLGLDGHGLPIGGQLIGPHFGEATLFRAAAVLERAFPTPAPPCVEAGARRA
jgi:aspartyl-tRNA(Asn)/glutamyl-tRNA(Gln) amidotransferase subunit A